MNDRPIHEEVEQTLEQARLEAEASFGRGYAKGREDQVLEDRYYVSRVTELSRLLAEAEAEIQRLRAR
jgi:hypothetical protein